MVDLAIIKTKGQCELIAVAKLQAQHFAALECHIAKGSINQFSEAQITINEFATGKANLRNICVGEIAISKCAMFIVALFEAAYVEVLLIKSLVVYVSFHVSGQISADVCKYSEWDYPEHEPIPLHVTINRAGGRVFRELIYGKY